MEVSSSSVEESQLGVLASLKKLTEKYLNKEELRDSSSERLNWGLLSDDDDMFMQQLMQEQSPPLEETQAADGSLCAKKKEAQGILAPAEAHGGEVNSELCKQQALLLSKYFEENIARVFPQQQAADGELCAENKEAEGMELEHELSQCAKEKEAQGILAPAEAHGAADGALCAEKKEDEGLLAQGGEVNWELCKQQTALMRKYLEENMRAAFFPQQQAADGELCAKNKEAGGMAQEHKLSQQEQKDLAERRSKLAYKYSLFEHHPDIVRLTKKTRPDLDSPNGQNVFYLPRDGCKDNDIQSDDEEQFYVPNSSRWLRKCLEEWGLETDDALRSKVRAAKQRFEIFTAGFCSEVGGGSGCGAIIRDSSHRPIVAKSKVGKSVSEFCLELEGVALGVQLAVEYEVIHFYLYCSSDMLELFLGEFLGESSWCYCSNERKIDDPCKACMKQWMRPDEDLDEAAFETIENIISNVSKLKDMGLSSFNVTSGGNGYGGGFKEGFAYYLAGLRKDQELKVKEIGEVEGLWNAIYEEVIGQYDKMEG